MPCSRRDVSVTVGPSGSSRLKSGASSPTFDPMERLDAGVPARREVSVVSPDCVGAVVAASEGTTSGSAPEGGEVASPPQANPAMRRAMPIMAMRVGKRLNPKAECMLIKSIRCSLRGGFAGCWNVALSLAPFLHVVAIGWLRPRGLHPESKGWKVAAGWLVPAWSSGAPSFELLVGSVDLLHPALRQVAELRCQVGYPIRVIHLYQTVVCSGDLIV